MEDRQLTEPRAPKTFVGDPSPAPDASKGVFSAPISADSTENVPGTGFGGSDAPPSQALNTEPIAGPTFQVVSYPDGSRRALMSTENFETVDMGVVNLKDADAVLHAAGKYDADTQTWDVDEKTVQSLLSGRLGLTDYIIAKAKMGEAGVVRGMLGRKILDGSMKKEDAVARGHEELLKVQLGEAPHLAWDGGFGPMVADVIRHPGEAARFALGEAAEQVPNMARAIVEGIKGSAVGVAAAGTAVVATGTVLTPAGAAAVPTGVAVGGAYGTWKYFVDSEAGATAIEMAEKDFDEKTIRELAPLAGVIKGTLESAGFAVMTAPAKKLFLKNVLASATVKKALASGLAQYLKSMGSEVSTELAQEKVDQIVNNMAATAEEKPELLLSPKDASDRLWETAVKTVAATAVLGGASAVVESAAARPKKAAAPTAAEKAAEKVMDAKIAEEQASRAPAAAPLPVSAKSKDAKGAAALPATATEGAAVDRAALLPQDAGYTITIEKGEQGEDMVIARDAAGVEMGHLTYSPADDSTFEDTPWITGDVFVEEKHRRKGVATALYDFAEKHTGKPIVPSEKLSEDGAAFWQARNPSLLDEMHGGTPVEAPALPQSATDGTLDALLAAHAADNITAEELVDGVSEAVALPMTPEDRAPGTKSAQRLKMEQTTIETARAAEVRAVETDIAQTESELDLLYADRARRKAAGERLANVDRQIDALVDRKHDLEYKKIGLEAPPANAPVDRKTDLSLKAATLADIADMGFRQGGEEARVQAQAEMDVAQEEFKAAKGEMRAAAQARLDAAREKFDTLVANTKSRPKAVKAVIDAAGLTAGEARRLLSDKKPLVTMSEAKFQEFLTEFESRAQYAAEWKKARAVVAGVLEEKALNNESRIREVLDLPALDKMNVAQLEAYARTLAKYEENDTILTAKLTDALKGTEMAGIDTMRGLVKAAAKILGVDPRAMSGIEFKDWYKYLPDTQLAAKHPLLDLTITYLKTAAREGTAGYLAFKEQNSKLAAAAMQSRAAQQTAGRRVANWFLNQQTEVMAYIEEQDPKAKTALASALTPEELKWADFWTDYAQAAYQYLLTSKALTGSAYVGTYVPHAKQSFLEVLGTLKSRGVKAFFKEVQNQFTKVEEQMSAMDAKGNPLGYKAFLANTLRRTGGLKPTRNIAESMNTYAKKFSGKVAFDRVVPVIDATVQAIKAAETDPDIQKINDISHQFIKDIINSKKGNAKGGGFKQGGFEETILRFGQTGASLAYIQLNFALQAASPIGATMAELPVLGHKGIALAKARKWTAGLGLNPHAAAILKKYQAFIGETLKSEVMDPAKPIQAKFNVALNVMWHVIHNSVMEDLLLGSMTDAEYAAGTISQDRLTHIEKEAGRWIDIRGSKSVVGSSVVGASFTQFKSWMVPPIHTTLEVGWAFVRALGTLGKKPMTNQQMWEMVHLSEVLVLTHLATARMGEDDPFDDSFKAKFWRYFHGELGSTLSIWKIGSFLTPFAGISWLGRALASLYLMTRFGEGEDGDNEDKREAGKAQFKKVAPYNKLWHTPEEK